jgi:hypothetical protein
MEFINNSSNPSKQKWIVLLSSILLTFGYWTTALWYQNQQAYSKDLVFFHFLFGSFASSRLDLLQYYFQFALTVFWFILVPYFITTRFLKLDFQQLVWRHTNDKTAIKICLLIYPLVLASTWFSSAEPVLQAEYPLSKLIGLSWMTFILYQLSYFFYFFAYESMFRGFLQFGWLSPKPGTKEIMSILFIQTLLTTLFHIGKPGTEILMAALFGPVFGYVSIRFNSIWYGMLIHYLMNVFMDTFILHRLHILPHSFF